MAPSNSKDVFVLPHLIAPGKCLYRLLGEETSPAEFLGSREWARAYGKPTTLVPRQDSLFEVVEDLDVAVVCLIVFLIC